MTLIKRSPIGRIKEVKRPSATEKKFRLNELHFEKNVHWPELKKYGFGEAYVNRELLFTKEEWESFKNTFMGTLNPGIAIQNNSKGEG